MRFLILLFGLLFLPQAQSVSDWKAQAPTDAGWKSAKIGMTAEEFQQAFAGEASIKMDQKFADGTKRPYGKLRNKFTVDGIEYEAEFFFDVDKRLNSLSLIANKIQQDTMANAVRVFTELRGEPTERKEEPLKNDIGKSELVAWKSGGTKVSL